MVLCDEVLVTNTAPWSSMALECRTSGRTLFLIFTNRNTTLASLGVRAFITANPNYVQLSAPNPGNPETDITYDCTTARRRYGRLCFVSC